MKNYKIFGITLLIAVVAATLIELGTLYIGASGICMVALISFPFLWVAILIQNNKKK